MRTALRIVVLMTCGLALAGPALAQPATPEEWAHGTTLHGLAGIATDSSSGPVVGGAVGWETAPGVAIEGRGEWFAFREGYDAFAGTLAVRVRLYGQRRIDPFVQAGVGLYRASFDQCGTTATSAAAAAGGACGSPDVPGFYRRRWTAAAPGPFRRTFTDPSLVVGGGVNLYVTRHLALRPDAEAIVVLRDRRQHVVSSVTLQAVFHFEEHPVTPARRAPR